MDPRHDHDREWDLGAWGDGEGCSAVRRTCGRYFRLDPATDRWRPMSKKAAVEILDFWVPGGFYET